MAVQWTKSIPQWDAGEREQYALSLGVRLPAEAALQRFLIDAMLSPLPATWGSRKSTQRGKIYFYNRITQTSQRAHPCEESFRELAQAFRRFAEVDDRGTFVRNLCQEIQADADFQISQWAWADSESGHRYYYHVDTRQQTWDRPDVHIQAQAEVKLQALNRLLDPAYNELLTQTEDAAMTSSAAEDYSAFSAAAKPTRPSSADARIQRSAASSSSHPQSPGPQRPRAASSDRHKTDPGLQPQRSRAPSSDGVEGRKRQSPAHSSRISSGRLGTEAKRLTFDDDNVAPVRQAVIPEAFNIIYARHTLGLRPEQGGVDQDILEVIGRVLMLRLPVPWEVKRNSEGNVYFQHRGLTGEPLWSHPLESFHRELVQILKSSVIDEYLSAEELEPSLASAIKKQASCTELVSEGFGRWVGPLERDGGLQVYEHEETRVQRTDDPRLAAASLVGLRLHALRIVWNKVMVAGSSNADPFPLSEDEIWAVAEQVAKGTTRKPGASRPKGSVELGDLLKTGGSQTRLQALKSTTEAGTLNVRNEKHVFEPSPDLEAEERKEQMRRLEMWGQQQKRVDERSEQGEIPSERSRTPVFAGDPQASSASQAVDPVAVIAKLNGLQDESEEPAQTTFSGSLAVEARQATLQQVEGQEAVLGESRLPPHAVSALNALDLQPQERSEDQTILSILSKVVSLRLPVPWIAQQDDAGFTFFRHPGLNDNRWDHPLQSIFTDLVDLLREGVAADGSLFTEALQELLAKRIQREVSRATLEGFGRWIGPLNEGQKGGMIFKHCVTGHQRSDDPKLEAASLVGLRLSALRVVWEEILGDSDSASGDPFPLTEKDIWAVAEQLALQTVKEPSPDNEFAVQAQPQGWDSALHTHEQGLPNLPSQQPLENTSIPSSPAAPIPSSEDARIETVLDHCFGGDVDSSEITFLHPAPASCSTSNPIEKVSPDPSSSREDTDQTVRELTLWQQQVQEVVERVGHRLVELESAGQNTISAQANLQKAVDSWQQNAENSLQRRLENILGRHMEEVEQRLQDKFDTLQQRLLSQVNEIDSSVEQKVQEAIAQSQPGIREDLQSSNERQLVDETQLLDVERRTQEAITQKQQAIQEEHQNLMQTQLSDITRRQSVTHEELQSSMQMQLLEMENKMQVKQEMDMKNFEMTMAHITKRAQETAHRVALSLIASNASTWLQTSFAAWKDVWLETQQTREIRVQEDITRRQSVAHEELQSSMQMQLPEMENRMQEATARKQLVIQEELQSLMQTQLSDIEIRVQEEIARKHSVTHEELQSSMQMQIPDMENRVQEATAQQHLVIQEELQRWMQTQQPDIERRIQDVEQTCQDRFDGMHQKLLSQVEQKQLVMQEELQNSAPALQLVIEKNTEELLEHNHRLMQEEILSSLQSRFSELEENQATIDQNQDQAFESSMHKLQEMQEEIESSMHQDLRFELPRIARNMQEEMTQKHLVIYDELQSSMQTQLLMETRVQKATARQHLPVVEELQSTMQTQLPNIESRIQEVETQLLKQTHVQKATARQHLPVVEELESTMQTMQTQLPKIEGQIERRMQEVEQNCQDEFDEMNQKLVSQVFYRKQVEQKQLIMQEELQNTAPALQLAIEGRTQQLEYNCLMMQEEFRNSLQSLFSEVKENQTTMQEEFESSIRKPLHAIGRRSEKAEEAVQAQVLAEKARSEHHKAEYYDAMVHIGEIKTWLQESQQKWDIEVSEAEQNGQIISQLFASHLHEESLREDRFSDMQEKVSLAVLKKVEEKLSMELQRRWTEVMKLSLDFDQKLASELQHHEVAQSRQLESVEFHLREQLWAQRLDDAKLESVEQSMRLQAANLELSVAGGASAHRVQLERLEKSLQRESETMQGELRLVEQRLQHQAANLERSVAGGASTYRVQLEHLENSVQRESEAMQGELRLVEHSMRLQAANLELSVAGGASAYSVQLERLEKSLQRESEAMQGELRLVEHGLQQQLSAQQVHGTNLDNVERSLQRISTWEEAAKAHIDTLHNGLHSQFSELGELGHTLQLANRAVGSVPCSPVANSSSRGYVQEADETEDQRTIAELRAALYRQENKTEQVQQEHAASAQQANNNVLSLRSADSPPSASINNYVIASHTASCPAASPWDRWLSPEGEELRSEMRVLCRELEGASPFAVELGGKAAGDCAQAHISSSAKAQSFTIMQGLAMKFCKNPNESTGPPYEKRMRGPATEIRDEEMLMLSVLVAEGMAQHIEEQRRVVNEQHEVIAIVQEELGELSRKEVAVARHELQEQALEISRIQSGLMTQEHFAENLWQDSSSLVKELKRLVALRTPVEEQLSAKKASVASADESLLACAVAEPASQSSYRGTNVKPFEIDLKWLKEQASKDEPLLLTSICIDQKRPSEQGPEFMSSLAKKLQAARIVDDRCRSEEVNAGVSETEMLLMGALSFCKLIRQQEAASAQQNVLEQHQSLLDSHVLTLQSQIRETSQLKKQLKMSEQTSQQIWDSCTAMVKELRKVVLTVFTVISDDKKRLVGSNFENIDLLGNGVVSDIDQQASSK